MSFPKRKFALNSSKLEILGLNLHWKKFQKKMVTINLSQFVAFVSLWSHYFDSLSAYSKNGGVEPCASV